MPGPESQLIDLPPYLCLPPRPLSLPPELLSLVFSFIAESRKYRFHDFKKRNATLFAGTLVSKAWSEPAYRELYGDLRLEWVGRGRRAIVKAFDANPSLHSRRWPSNEDGDREGEDEREAEALFDAHRTAAIIFRGERDWYDGPPGVKAVEREAADAFWFWASRHPNATALYVESFEHPMPQVDGAVPPLSRQLEHVRLGGEFTAIGEILPYLDIFKTLSLRPHAISSLQGYLWTRLGEGPLRRLEKLSTSEPAMLFDVLPQHSPLPNLVTMKLYSNPWSESELCIGCLPELPALRSLILTPHSRIESSTPLRLLSTSSLSHIHLKSWPSPTLLDSLPWTAELLNFDLNGDRFDKDANAR